MDCDVSRRWLLGVAAHQGLGGHAIAGGACEMARHRVGCTSIAILSMALVVGADAQQDTQGASLQLSAPLRTALIAEMQQVDASMQRIVAGLARADWPALVEAAGKIEGSFILEQKLSAEQRTELHTTLPRHFLTLDARFHDTAKRMSAAARARDAELATFYTYRLAESCVSCHAQYALHRFPAFAIEKRTDH